MALYGVGQEDHEFTKVGASCSVDTATTAQRRTANARCSLKVASSPNSTDGWQYALWSPQSLFWMTARWGWTVGIGGSSLTASDMICFVDGIRRRLIVTCDGSSSAFPFKWRLSKRNAAGTTTVLQTSSVNTPPATSSTSAPSPHKIDVFVNYSVTGQVMVFVDGTKVLDYSGDVTTDSATTLDGAVLGLLVTHPSSTGVASYWSEMIISSSDTRALSLNKLSPAANGNAFTWSNSFASINEVTTDDTGLCASSVANDIAEVTVDSSSITGTPGIVAVVVTARAQKGGTGPANAKLMVRTGGADFLGSNKALSTTLSLISDAWETDPNTGNAWAYTALTAAGFNTGIKSLT